MTLPVQGIILPPGGGKQSEFSTGEAIVKALGADTHGHLDLIEYIMPPAGFSPQLHIHHNMEEMFYVVEGEVEITVGEQTVQAQPSAFVLVPRGTPHRFENKGTETAKVLVLSTPATSRDQFYEALAELVKHEQPPDPKALAELMKRFDQEIVATE